MYTRSVPTFLFILILPRQCVDSSVGLVVNKKVKEIFSGKRRLSLIVKNSHCVQLGINLFIVLLVSFLILSKFYQVDIIKKFFFDCAIIIPNR